MPGAMPSAVRPARTTEYGLYANQNAGWAAIAVVTKQEHCRPSTTCDDCRLLCSLRRCPKTKALALGSK